MHSDTKYICAWVSARMCVSIWKWPIGFHFVICMCANLCITHNSMQSTCTFAVNFFFFFFFSIVLYNKTSILSFFSSSFYILNLRGEIICDNDCERFFHLSVVPTLIVFFSFACCDSNRIDDLNHFPLVFTNRRNENQFVAAFLFVYGWFFFAKNFGLNLHTSKKSG